ncbi:MAG: PTS sugar transporter subunit IIA [Treponema sp.]|jgi:PTS system nitrogen regulatory IIA component|nr:PTS sugar transporter subunit IIA [Treponema sp.]
MTDNNELSLAALVERGGVYYDVPGASPKDLIASVIGLMPPIKDVDPDELQRQIMEREALVSTGIGHGIALPHPRNPALPGANAPPLVAIAFPVMPIDWNTQDGSKVHTVFLIISASAKQHLNTLSKINFLCQKEKFHSLIEARVSKKEIVAAIKEAENSWVNK